MQFYTYLDIIYIQLHMYIRSTKTSKIVTGAILEVCDSIVEHGSILDVYLRYMNAVAMLGKADHSIGNSSGPYSMQRFVPTMLQHGWRLRCKFCKHFDTHVSADSVGLRAKPFRPKPEKVLRGSDARHRSLLNLPRLFCGPFLFTQILILMGSVVLGPCWAYDMQWVFVLGSLSWWPMLSPTQGPDGTQLEPNTNKGCGLRLRLATPALCYFVA